jgi:hypothetical protein
MVCPHAWLVSLFFSNHDLRCSLKYVKLNVLPNLESLPGIKTRTQNSEQHGKKEKRCCLETRTEYEVCFVQSTIFK